MSRNNPFNEANRPHWEKKAVEGQKQASGQSKPSVSIQREGTTTIRFGDVTSEISQNIYVKKSRTFEQMQMDAENNRLQKIYDDAMNELNALQGMDTVKDTILESLSLAKTFQQREKFDLKNIQHALHMIFTGNAGTGKTTIARLVGDLYVGAGLLKKGNFVPAKSHRDRNPFGDNDAHNEKEIPFIECSNADISSPFWGEDERNMKIKFDQANGGVLFIDEAYSMISRSGHRSGEKVMAVMVQEMENRRNSVCVIGAGYPKEMEEFLSYNEGLSSRFATVVHFPNYDVEVLMQIAQQMALERDYKFSEDYRIALAERLEKERLLKNFGNARTVRNIIEQSIRKHAKRISETIGSSATLEELIQLKKEDLAEFNPIYTGEHEEDEYLKLYNEAIKNGLVSSGGKMFRKTPRNK
jgi:stage V sporulation protein K